MQVVIYIFAGIGVLAIAFGLWSAAHFCPTCDNTGWVCENCPGKPWGGTSTRRDACDCGAGMACQCNPMSRDAEQDEIRALANLRASHEQYLG